jgi:hypothetical protein
LAELASIAVGWRASGDRVVVLRDAHDGRVGEPAIEVQQPGGICPGDGFVYWALARVT